MCGGASFLARHLESASGSLNVGGAQDRRANAHAIRASRVQRRRALGGDPADDDQRHSGCGAHAAQQGIASRGPALALVEVGNIGPADT